MNWITQGLMQPVEEPPAREDREPAPDAPSAPREAADWQRGMERRQWELAFKLESLSMQYEQLDTVQREQAAQIEALTVELRESSAEREELRGELDESHEAVEALQLENRRLHEAIRGLIARIPGSTRGTHCRVREAEAEALVDKQPGPALPTCGRGCEVLQDLPTGGRSCEVMQGGPVDWSRAGERTLSSTGCASNASTTDSSGHAGSSSDGPLAR